MIFELAKDFHDAVAALSKEHPKHRILELLEEAIRRDIHFIARHPTTLFQCLWNTCWWYDCPEAAAYYDEPECGWKAPPWKEIGSNLFTLMEAWLITKSRTTPDFRWARSLRPPTLELRLGQIMILPGRYKNGWASVAWSPAGDRIATGGWDGELSVWDATSGIELFRVHGHPGPVYDVSFSPSGQSILTCSQLVHSDKQAIFIWDAADGSQLIAIHGESMGQFMPDGKHFLTCSNGTLRVLDATAGTESLSFPLPDGLMAVSPDGRRIVLRRYEEASESEVVLRDLSNGHEVCCAGRHGLDPHVALFSPNGDTFAGEGGDQAVAVWDAHTGKQVASLVGYTDRVTAVGYTNRVTALSFSPNGEFIAAGFRDQTIRVWDLRTMEGVCCFEGHTGTTSDQGVPIEVRGIAWSPEGNAIASTSFSDDFVRVWRVGKMTPRRKLLENRMEVTCLAFSADGRRAASGSAYGDACIWDTHTGKLLHRLSAAKRVHTVTFSSDDKTLVTDGSGGGNCLWDVESGESLGQGGPSYEKHPPEVSERCRYRFTIDAIGGETVISDLLTRAPVTWFSVPLEHCASDSSGHCWGGSFYNHVFLIAFEGECMP